MNLLKLKIKIQKETNISAQLHLMAHIRLVLDDESFHGVKKIKITFFLNSNQNATGSSIQYELMIKIIWKIYNRGLAKR